MVIIHQSSWSCYFTLVLYTHLIVFRKEYPENTTYTLSNLICMSFSVLSAFLEWCNHVNECAVSFPMSAQVGGGPCFIIDQFYVKFLFSLVLSFPQKNCMQ